MNGQIEVIGNSSEVIDYNLNEQFSNVKKIVVTSTEILEAFEDVGAIDAIEKLQTSAPENYLKNLKAAYDQGIFDSTISSELYKEITDKLTSISENLMDIQLQGYNFMNSVSNSKFTITLRCEQFSISRYYEEKGSFLSIFRTLLKEYLEFNQNTLRLKNLKNFQIEISESEEMHKHVYLKKDGSKLILSSTFGFPKSAPIDFNSGSEFYYSTGKGFDFFKNNQTTAIIRQHNQLSEKPIQTREKILSDDELVAINNKTKHIHDATIELYLSSKGKIKIVNVSILENQIQEGSKTGFYINKSTNNYDKISLLSLRDDLTQETVNPKYLLLKNSGDIQTFLKTNPINELDGIVLTENTYIPYFDYIGHSKNIDVIFQNTELSKSLDIELDSQNVKIGSEENQTQSNPFNNIIDENNKERDFHLERLKSIDLSTPTEITEQRQREQQNINNIATGMIANENSTMAQNNYNPNSFSSNTGSSEPGKKLSALDMLANSALNKPADQVAESQTQAPVATPVQAVAQTTQSSPQSSFNNLPASQPGQKMSALDMLMHSAENHQTVPAQPETQAQAPVQPEPVQSQVQTPQTQYNQPIQEEIVNIQSQPEQPIEQNTNNSGMVDHFGQYMGQEQASQSIQEQPVPEQVENEVLNREMANEIADEIIVENFEQNPVQSNEQFNQFEQLQETEQVEMFNENNFEQNYDSYNQSGQTSEQIPNELMNDMTSIETQDNYNQNQYSNEFENFDQIQQTEQFNQVQDNFEQETSQVETANVDIQVDLNRYLETLATKLIAQPNVVSNHYFVDSSNVANVTNPSEMFYLTPNVDDLTNESLNYVLPMGVTEEFDENHSYILNSTNDYFLLPDEKINMFINLSYIEDSIKENFLKRCLNHAKSAYVVVEKKDISLVEEHIEKLEGVFVKDLDSQDEFNQIQNTILSHEKNYLFKKLNK